MEVKGQLISAPDSLCCQHNKERAEQMMALQERRRSLQALLSTRLAELRRVCLQEAELTGEVPADYPLEAGEKPPHIRRRVGTSRHGARNPGRKVIEEAQCSKLKKTLFSGALRKHTDSEQNTHTNRHTHHGKRTVHRGCHTDDTGTSESSSTSDSTYDNDDSTASLCRPLLVSDGAKEGAMGRKPSPLEVYYEINARRNSLASNSPSQSLPRGMSNPDGRSVPVTPLLSRNGPITAHIRSDQSEALLTHKPLPLPASHHVAPHLPPPSRDSSASSGLSELGGEGGANTASRGSRSDTMLDRTNPSLEAGGGGGIELKKGWGGVYVWGKQQKTQLQRQQSHGNPLQPITSQHTTQYNGYLPHPAYPPPLLRGQPGEPRRVKVTRTKSCGPLLQHTAPPGPHQHPSIQPDPHPNLLPPRPPQHLPAQDGHLEEATKSLHKALALEGLRDWYLRNTLGSAHQNQINGKVSTGVKVQEGRGALQRRRTTHGVIQQPAYQMDTHQQYTPSLQHQQGQLPHSATFHGHPLHGRSLDGSLYHNSFPLQQRQEVSLKAQAVDQPSPGTLV
ncbi:coiled-coil domain-containing protein 120 [Lampris incognitus]|uniref:coiled-coil domain-containing protein 120 n=1 Tax=Lampris incognitus TaxID=2546036 RepID=UPI0024B606A7|nr:coiled-coil domain-containing protein 120 [Lampris incognitus]